MAGNGLLGTAHAIPNALEPKASGLGRKETQFNSNGEPRAEMLLYVPSSLQGNINQGQPYFVDYSKTAGQYILASAPAGNATSGIARLCVVLMDSETRTGTMPITGAYGWFAYEGTVDKVLVDGTTSVAAGDYLRSNSTVISSALIKDASTRSDLSVGMALAAQAAASAVLIKVFLTGESALIA